MNDSPISKEEVFGNIIKNFDYLIPRDTETILLLLTLYSKIEKREIDEIFSRQDFEEAVDEVILLLKRERNIQRENISKRLSQYFYTTLKSGEEYRYQLTIFAKEFAKLLLNEVAPNYENLELVYTFKRTLPIYDEDIANIEKLTYWHKHHFIPSQRFILAHTDNLQRYVDKKVAELRTLLKPHVQNPKELITQFLGIFEQLGKQTEGVTKALNFKQDIIDKIKSSESNFQDAQKSWEQYDRIQNEVVLFFENIDSRVLSINDKIQQARTRLKSLYDNLRYKQLYKIKIEKFLLLLLKHSRTIEDKIFIPVNIPKKEVPYFRDKFLYPPLIGFMEFHKMETPFYPEDEALKKLNEQEKMKQLARQENTIKWMDTLRGEIENQNEIVFEYWMDKIIAQEQNLEVPIDVCYELIDEYKNREDISLEIEKKLTMPLHSNVAVWKLSIKPI